MTPPHFLPVVERELRVRARQRFTPWLRVIVGAIAGLVAALVLQITSSAPGLGPPGQVLLGALGWFTFAICLVEGLRQTTDSLNREQREGTLGLLFLTDLRGVDVVVGKLAACSVQSFYGLLAVFPAMGIALAAGGTTAGEFWRTQLVLLETLLLALACGLWASARRLDEHRALVLGVGMVLGVTLLPPLVEAFLLPRGLPSISPGTAMFRAADLAYRASPGAFWGTAVAIPLLSVLLVWSAGRRLARGWHEPAPVTAPPQPKQAGPVEWTYRPSPGLHARPAKPVLDRDPLWWLAQRQRPRRLLLWIAALTPLLFLITRILAFRVVGPGIGVSYGLSLAVGAIGTLLPVLILAIAASQRLVESRNEGTLELLLTTPLSPRRIVESYWLSVWRVLRWPLFLMLLLQTGALFLQGFAGTSIPGVFWIYLLFSQVGSGVHHVALAVAACWMAMWFAVRAHKTSSVVGLTLLWTAVVSWLGAMICQVALGLVFSPLFSTRSSGWIYPFQLLIQWLPIVYLVYLVFWARHRLFTRLRQTVAGAE